MALAALGFHETGSARPQALVREDKVISMDFGDHVAYVIRAHRDRPITPGAATRRWDKKTPYSIHPIWCAMTILTETALPYDVREDGSLALLYHDIREDTTAGLHPGLPERVVAWVDGMTFEGASRPGGSDIKRREIWNRPPEIRMLELYDSTSSLLDAAWAPPERLALYKDFVRRLVEDVAPRYGELNIVKIARAVLL